MTSDLGWTTKRPECCGYFWMRNYQHSAWKGRVIDGEPRLMEISESGIGLEFYVIGDDRSWRLDGLGGEFAGPLEPPR